MDPRLASWATGSIYGHRRDHTSALSWLTSDCAQRRELPVARQVSLLETLAAAASQMAAADKSRPTAGPPPLLFLQRTLPPADHLKPQHLNLFLAKAPAESAIGNSPFYHSLGPFLPMHPQRLPIESAFGC